MIGTAEQISYAKKILAGAKVWHQQVTKDPEEIKAIEYLEAVDAQDWAVADRVYDSASDWVDLAIDDSGDEGHVVARVVIGMLEDAFLSAKKAGLLP